MMLLPSLFIHFPCACLCNVCVCVFKKEIAIVLERCPHLCTLGGNTLMPVNLFPKVKDVQLPALTSLGLDAPYNTDLVAVAMICPNLHRLCVSMHGRLDDTAASFATKDVSVSPRPPTHLLPLPSLHSPSYKCQKLIPNTQNNKVLRVIINIICNI